MTIPPLTEEAVRKMNSLDLQLLIAGYHQGNQGRLPKMRSTPYLQGYHLGRDDRKEGKTRLRAYLISAGV
jgi:hypothetical protein